MGTVASGAADAAILDDDDRRRNQPKPKPARSRRRARSKHVWLPLAVKPGHEHLIGEVVAYGRDKLDLRIGQSVALRGLRWKRYVVRAYCNWQEEAKLRKWLASFKQEHAAVVKQDD